jgi:hypothetical protein
MITLMPKLKSMPKDLTRSALASADEAIKAGDAVAAERWLKVARQAAAMAQEQAASDERTEETDPAARLAAHRRRRDKVIAVIGRRLERLNQLPDDVPLNRIPPKQDR